MLTANDPKQVKTNKGRHTPQQLKRRRDELTSFNQMFKNEFGEAIGVTAFDVNRAYLSACRNKKKCVAWARGATMEFVGLLRKGGVKWCNGSLGSRWYDCNLDGVFTRVAFCSAVTDDFYNPFSGRKYVIILDPHELSH